MDSLSFIADVIFVLMAYKFRTWMGVRGSIGAKRASRIERYGERVTDAGDAVMRQERWRSGQLRWTHVPSGAKLIGMIAKLEGKVSEKIGEVVVIDCGGVGYGVLVTFEDFGALHTGETTKLYIYENIRENAHDLFGFRSKEAKTLFEQLLSVKGIGPKMALAILSVASLSRVRQAIAAGDIKFLSQSKGVGKRAAERVVVDLKDKVGLAASIDATEFLTTSADPSDEALQGLVALGYSVQDAAQALKKVDTKLPAPERIKQALKA